MSGKKDNDEDPKGETLRIENEGIPRPPAPPLPPRKNVSAITVPVIPAYDNLESVQLIPSISRGPIISARYSRNPQNYRRDPEMALTAVGLDDQRCPECRHASSDMKMCKECCLFCSTSVAVYVIGIVLLLVIYYCATKKCFF